MKNKAYLVLPLIVAWAYFSVLPAHAQSTPNLDPNFNPNYILTNDDIFDVYGMSYDYLKNFLHQKGALADLQVTDIDGKVKNAVDVIWRVANSYKLNPKYLIALLQKEQSLVEDSSPSQRQLDWATGFAVCDSCSKDDPDLQSFKGFANQLEWAAKQHREKYLMQLLSFGTTISGKAVGKSMNVDGIQVIPQNQATAMLYTYTPHLNGNQNLWKIWRRWFSLNYPNGTVVRGLPSNKTYLIQLGEKKLFESPAVLASMSSPDKIVEVSDTELSAYPNGDLVKFPKFSLLKTEANDIYLLVTDGKRKFSSIKSFNKFGFLEDEIMDVSSTEVADIPDLAPITATSTFPTGALAKSSGSSAVYYIENDVKHALPDGVFLKLYFSGRPIKTLAKATLDKYQTGEPYAFQNGELVSAKSTPAVYVVEDGKLRPILSGDVFESMGWKWTNVVKVADRLLTAYQVTDPITLAGHEGTDQITQATQ